MSNEELGINSSFFTPHSSFICTLDLMMVAAAMLFLMLVLMLMAAAMLFLMLVLMFMAAVSSLVFVEDVQS